MGSQQKTESTSLRLPSLWATKNRTPIGEICHLLHGQRVCEVLDTEVAQVSPKRTESLSVLASGERIVVTDRKICPHPIGVDGVLFRGPGGESKWLFHQAAEEFDARLDSDGLAEIKQASLRAWKRAFRYQTERVDDSGQVIESGLRPPQVGALPSIGSHWSLHRHPATIVMPTGTGKTETMLATLAAFMNGTMLVVVPNGPLKAQTIGKFTTFGLLRELGVLPGDVPNPVVGVINKRPQTAADLEPYKDCHVIVATMSAVAQGTAAAVIDDLAKIADTLVVDEAHHITAKSWATFRDSFKDQRVLQFTATPFRRDGELVDGDVIYSYPLRRAQTDGYFKPITFNAVHELEPDEADEAVAIRAISQLNDDLTAGWNHLLMARCKEIERATEVHKLYCKLAPNHQPLLVHSKDAESANNLAKLRSGESRIVVCVNMLGEGFDLPELKIAAVHDTHKSLAVLLQFTGRFTRSSGKNIGDATVVANVADIRVSDALERLYIEDADWNRLLSEFSSQAVKEHSQLIDFLSKSIRLNDRETEDIQISNQLLRPKFSAVVYNCTEFHPKKFHDALSKDTAVHAVWLHNDTNTVYFVTRREPPVGWTRSREICDRLWDLFVIHFDPSRNLLFVNSTDKSSVHVNIAEAIGSDSVQIIKGDNVFRTLGNINRLRFQNIGVRKFGRRNLRYAKYNGGDVKEALSLAQTSGSLKSDLSGTGYENGCPVTIGCSIKGRVWSMAKGSVRGLLDWCEVIGAKIADESIDTTKIIENVLIPDEVDKFPTAYVLSIDWPIELIKQSEEKVILKWGGNEVPITLFELGVDVMAATSNTLKFSVSSDDFNCPLHLTLGGTCGFEVKQLSGPTVFIKAGRVETSLSEYFSDCPPLIRFADMSELDGNLLVHPQDTRELVLPPERFEPWDWTGVNIQAESIWNGKTKRTDSIQGYVAKHYDHGGFTLIFDDDCKGEAADLVCLKEEPEYIRLSLIHCKFTSSDEAGKRLSDVVEVCSQAVRSAKWQWRFRELCRHLLSREKRLKKPHRPTRFIKGDAKELNRFLQMSRFKDLRVEVVIAQPGISLSNCGAEQLTVLAAADGFLLETAGVELGIVCNH